MKTQLPIEKFKKEFYKFNEISINKALDFFIFDKESSNLIKDFINENVKDFNRNMYVKQDAYHIDHIYDRGGFAIGAFDKDDMVSVMCVDISLEKSKFKKINSRTIVPTKKSVVFDTVVVNEKYRNMNLSGYMMMIGEYLSLKKGFENAFCTLSPYNYFLVTNAVNLGFYIYALIDMYGDMETGKNSVKRYLAHLPLGKKRAEVEEQYACKCLDFDAQQEVLDLGFCGFKTINYKSIDDYFLSYSMMYYD